MAEIQSLARGLQILEYLANAPDGLGITELAAELKVDKGTASRLAQTLAQYGYVEKDTDSRRYQLGPQVVNLSRIVITRMPLREAAKPFLKRLVAETGECAHIAVLSRGMALYIDQVESPATLRVNAEVGHLAPLHCTALGKALMAFSGCELPEKMETRTARTITDPEVLKLHLEQIRRQGYAVDDEEYDMGVRCVAAPVFDFRDKMVGAIGISGPAARVTPEKLCELSRVVVGIARELSDRLRFRVQGQ